jgi:hypothetical protein
MEHRKIDVELKADREALAVILAKNGYTVRIGKEMRGKTSKYTHFVEYWR